MKTKPAALRISYRNADFEGEISQNKVKSRGFAFFSSGNSYYGEWKKGLFEGNGIFIHFTGIVIKGHFLQGKLDGCAEILYCKEKRPLTLWKKGEFYQENRINIKESHINSQKSLYENLSMNEPVLKPRDSNSFIFDAFFDEKSFRFYGNWKNLKPNGLGFSLSPTSLEIGDFKNGNLTGFCRKISSNGDIFCGNPSQGSCFFYEKETKDWNLSYFKNNEKLQLLKSGNSLYPPILQFTEENSLIYNENLAEDAFEKAFLQEIVSIYMKINPESPIIIPIIAIQEKKPQEEVTFSNIYNKIIDKNNPFCSPKQRKGQISPIILQKNQRNHLDSEFLQKKGSESPLKFLNSPIDPIETMNSITKAPNSSLYKHKTSQNLSKCPKKSPFIAISKGFSSTKKELRTVSIDNKFSMRKSAGNTTNFDFYNDFPKAKANSNLFIEKTPKKHDKILKSTKSSPFYLKKNSNPIFLLEEEKKAESPMNRLITQLKKSSPEDKSLDILKQIEGINTIIEAALTEDTNFSKKILRKKSQSFTTN